MAERVMLEETKVFDKPMKRQILSSFPPNYLQTLYSHRKKIIGKIPGSREEFDPEKVLRSLEFGDAVICLDSNKLPDKWWQIALTSLIPADHIGHGISEAAGLNSTLPDDLFSGIEDDWKPERVLVFTTPQLIEMLTFIRKAHVDGTFRTMSKLWCQLYVLLVEYKQTSILSCLGFLPDKKRLSYHVFLLLILLEFRLRFGVEKLRLEKVKMDFELGTCLHFKLFSLSCNVICILKLSTRPGE